MRQARIIAAKPLLVAADVIQWISERVYSLYLRAAG